MRNRSKDLAVLDNKLVLAGYNLEETEHKLILALLGELQPNVRDKAQSHGGSIASKEGEAFDPTKVYQLSVKDFAELYGMRLDNARTLLKQASLELFKKHILFKEPSEGKTSYIHWAQKVVFNEKEDTIGIMWTYDVARYLFQLSKGFTRYRLGDIARLKGAYTIRLYELWQSRYAERGKQYEVVFKLDELYFSMAVPESRREYAEFKRRVLLPAVAELKGKNVVTLGINEKKEGRKVVGIGFIVGKVKEVTRCCTEVLQ